MAIDAEMEKEILKRTAPIIAAAGTAMVIGAIGSLLECLGVNMKTSSMAGDQNLQPTEDSVSASTTDVAAVETEGKLAQDKVAAVEGEVKASETEARAMTGEATAADSGASALRTKAGASDIEVKALKMT